MNIFGYPYFSIDSDGNITPSLPSTLPLTGITTPPVDPAQIPELIAGSVVGSDGTPIFEVICTPSALGGTTISWGLKRGFGGEDPGPYYFDVWWAETPTGTFEKVPTPTLINTYWCLDPVRRLWAYDIESYYAIRITTPKGVYWSYVSSENSNFDKRSFLIARDVARKEWLLCRKFVGWQGFLLKRIVWGPDCSCVDFDSKEVPVGHCQLCFGTGKLGGYWPPYPSWAYPMKSGPTSFKQLDDSAGLTENTVLSDMRMLCFPLPSTNDIFIHTGTGRRYFIRPVNVTSEIKGVPVTYNVEFRLVPRTDVAYEYPGTAPTPPVPPEPPGPESESEPVAPPAAPLKIKWADGEWQLGLDGAEPMYRTTGGYPMSNALDSFTWVPPLAITDQDTGYVIAADGVSGLYMPNGTYAGLDAFVQVIE